MSRKNSCCIVSRGNRCAVLFLIVLLFIFGESAFALQPIRFNYQAKLTAQNGSFLSGSHTLFLSLWDGGTSSVAGSGTQLFGESATENITNGIANVTVGTGTNTFGGPLDDSMFTSSNDIFLQVAVDTELNVVLPRTRVESVPFAARSRIADSAANGVPAGSVILSPSPAPVEGYAPTGASMYNHWVLRTPMNAARQSFNAAVSNGKIYAIGGYNQIPQVLGVTEEFDPTNDRWTTKSAMGIPRGLPTVTELNGLIYAVGGSTMPVADVPASKVTEAYNPQTDTWTTKQQLTHERETHSAAAANGQIYVFGGATNSSATTSTATVEAYDPGGNVWTLKAPMPHGRLYSVAATVNGTIYVIGGLEDLTTFTCRNEAYDPINDTWTIKTPPPLLVWYAGNGAAVGGKIYLTGGLFSTDFVSLDPTPLTWIYDPPTDSWSIGVTLPTSRAFPAATTVNGKLFVLGGVDPAAATLVSLPLVESIDPTILYVLSRP